MKATNELLIFGIENPMLDLTNEFSTDEILRKYNLEYKLACLANEQQMPIFDELYKLEGTKRTPGGSALNTIRSANFMLKNSNPDKCAYFGSIGEDEQG